MSHFGTRVPYSERLDSKETPPKLYKQSTLPDNLLILNFLCHLILHNVGAISLYPKPYIIHLNPKQYSEPAPAKPKPEGLDSKQMQVLEVDGGACPLRRLGTRGLGPRI